MAYIPKQEGSVVGSFILSTILCIVGTIILLNIQNYSERRKIGITNDISETLTALPTITALSTYTPIPSNTPFPTQTPEKVITLTPTPTSTYAKWKSDQLIKTFIDLGLPVKLLWITYRSDYPDFPMLVTEYAMFSYEYQNYDYLGYINIYDNERDLEIDFSHPKINPNDGEIHHWIISADNVIIAINNDLPEKEMEKFADVFFSLK